jgi:archaemetzincin
MRAFLSIICLLFTACPVRSVRCRVLETLLSLFPLLCALLTGCEANNLASALCLAKLTNDSMRNSDSQYNFNPNHIAFKDDSDFEKMPPPKPGEWLYEFKEKGQTFEQYVSKNPNRPSSECFRIYLQPIGQFNPQQQDILNKVREFASIFFQTDVVITSTIPLPTTGYRERKETYKKWTQYHSLTILDKLLKPNLPKDAFCYLGITISDLYPDESWNFVFGQASLKERVGVYSLARYSPEFYGEKETQRSQLQILRRSCKVLSHETGHMYGINHCIFYRCDMSGSNSLEEMDSRPIHLCPICLKKLAWNSGLDIIEREQKLLKFYNENKFKEEYNWTLKRLARIKK